MTRIIETASQPDNAGDQALSMKMLQDKMANENVLLSSAQRSADLQTAVPAPASIETAAALPQITLTNDIANGTADLESRSVVVVDKTHHRTHILQMNNGRVEEVLNTPDATGKGPKMTPEGRFHIIGKEQHPTWYPPPSIGGSPVGPGPRNPLGVAKIRTDAGGGLILMHGTNRPDQIGTNASHGCIRHQNADIMKIYPLVERGDAVYIVKDFNGTNVRLEDFRS